MAGGGKIANLEVVKTRGLEARIYIYFSHYQDIHISGKPDPFLL